MEFEIVVYKTSAIEMSSGRPRVGRLWSQRDVYPSRVEIVNTWKVVRTGVSTQWFTRRKCRDNIFGLSLID
jgi:hypothetical protein